MAFIEIMLLRLTLLLQMEISEVQGPPLWKNGTFFCEKGVFWKGKAGKIGKSMVEE